MTTVGSSLPMDSAGVGGHILGASSHVAQADAASTLGALQHSTCCAGLLALLGHSTLCSSGSTT